jgi:hypothetical protein
MRGDSRTVELLDDVAPAGAALQRERHIGLPDEPLQPPPEVCSVSRGDPPAHHLAGVEIHVIECQLRPVNINTTHDRHDDSPRSGRFEDGRRGGGRHIPSS